MLAACRTTCVSNQFTVNAVQASATPQPPRSADRDAAAAEALPDLPCETAQQRVSELLERLAAQQREFEQSLQQQQAAFQATLREEVDIRVALQTCVSMGLLENSTLPGAAISTADTAWMFIF